MNKHLLLLLLISILITNCSAPPFSAVTIRIKGSDTMLRLTGLLAEEYMKKNPGTSIYVEGGGTATGIRALSKNEIDICTASRNLKADEVKLLADEFGSLGISTLIAKDGLSVFMHPENSIKNLTMQQLKDIFTCKLKNWSELGGDNSNIMVISRSPNSGTHLYFKEHVLDSEEYCSDAVIKTTTESITALVKSDRRSIGYGGIGYSDADISASINGILSTEENVRNDSYPITRYLYFYTLQTPRGVVKEFIDWVVSPEGQKVVKRAGFISLWEISF